MLECPKCKTLLRETPVVMPKNHGGGKIIGKQKFCPKMGCDFEGKITRR